MYTFVFYLLSLPLCFSYTMAGNSSSPAYIPNDYILLDCGSSTNTTSEDGRKWSPDERSKFSISNPENTSFVSMATSQDQTVTQVPYMSARGFREKFTYRFPVRPGLKFLRLYFYVAEYSGFSGTTAFFSVAANNYILLKNFSAFLTASAKSPPQVSLVKEFMVPVFETDQMLNVTFLPSPNSLAFVNGIEVVSIPNNLYGGDQKYPVTFVTNTHISFDIPNTTAFETVYRLNVGGSDVANVKDTGMFRTWLDDSPYIVGAATGTVSYLPDVVIYYNEETPVYTAPAVVYGSSRTMGPHAKINMQYNLTWAFSVETGFNYLFRLHFCEYQREVTGEGQRPFEIYINNQTATFGADVIGWSGGNSIPVYRDYALLVPTNDQTHEQDVWLALHPEAANFNDAILNGLEIFRINNSDGSLAVPNPELKLREPYQGYPVRKKDGMKHSVPTKVIIGVSLSSAATVLVSLILGIIFWLKKRLSVYRRKSMEIRKVSQLPDKLCECFTLVDILTATNNFDDDFVIGRGGFGNVYKGFIKGIKREVAIKRLNPNSQQGAKEFLTEIKLLSQLRHVHLVSLIGYCNDFNEMILVYDYMANGTLRDHLYKTDKTPLSWKQRLEICIGAAKGLDYLHSGAIHSVIHRDVKSTNILLDENWVPKVSDFGLCKMSPISLTDVPVTTVVKGTFGYLDPDYYRYQKLTEKSDVYSFGVLLFEVLCARPAVDSKLTYSQIGLANWARKCMQNGCLGETIDPVLKDKTSPYSLRTYAQLAENCIRENGLERPTMNDVVQGLEFALQLQEIEDAEQKSHSVE